MSIRNYNRVYVAGHRGLVGSALVRILEDEGVRPLTQTREQLDLSDSTAVRRWFSRERPDLVFLAAARVGGIEANRTHPWDFLAENLAIQQSVLGAALESDTARVVFFGSSCIYPKLAHQPIAESELLTGPLESTNEAYAIAKIAGLKLVEAANVQHGRSWVSLMPTNLYGPGDNFDRTSSHVLPALIRKFHDAKSAREASSDSVPTLWGSGTPMREFLHVDDLAAASTFIASTSETGLFNVGFGSDVSIAELAGLIAEVVGYDGRIVWDGSKPDGTPRKLLDSTRMRALGWRPRIPLRSGIEATYEWFCSHVAH